jgi:putative transposase
MSYIKVYVHYVWTTSNTFPFLFHNELRIAMWNHIKLNGMEKGIHVDFINGYSDHCHCLVSLGKEQTLSKVAQLLKGESSFWANKNQLTKSKFSWQDEYYAGSVSYSEIDKVRRYIQNQEEHHKKITFQEECDVLITEWGLTRMEDGSVLYL